MPKQRKKRAMRTNQAVAIGEVGQKKALKEIAFGNEWSEFEEGIEGRIVEYGDIDPVKQSTRRALGMIREMMFEKL